MLKSAILINQVHKHNIHRDIRNDNLLSSIKLFFCSHFVIIVMIDF